MNLTTHINDIVDHIRAANLDDVTLVGHSYEVLNN
ncbi:UNVERIFIED_CONTAM: pimeloyl-ACP methyl ester carboxylesterase [Paenibacillus sp. PvR008]